MSEPTTGRSVQRARPLEPLVPLEVVISTAELAWRSCRAPEYEAESQVLVELAGQMIRSPASILEHLVTALMRLCRGGSAGVSIIDEHRGEALFRSHALSGEMAAHLWGTTPRDFSPCGMVVDSNSVQLMSDPELHYRYLAEVRPKILEALLIPFTAGAQTAGTLWVVTHDATQHFDAEDGRLIADLGKFASACYQAYVTHARANHSQSGWRADKSSEVTAAAALDGAARALREQLGQQLHWHAQALSDTNRESLRSLIGLIDGLPALAGK
jgi:transcriptional regulator with GAF, ATPase, and Fis domain